MTHTLRGNLSVAGDFLLLLFLYCSSLNCFLTLLELLFDICTVGLGVALNLNAIITIILLRTGTITSESFIIFKEAARVICSCTNY